MACQYKSRVWENGWCNVACSYCTLTQEGTCKHNKQTNADRIRAMSDEELASIIASTPICKERYMDCLKYGRDCEPCLLEWLKQPAEEGADNG